MSDIDRRDLPLSDYDHLPAGALRDRVRSLTEGEVRQLLDYEQEHAARAPIITALSARLEELAAGATPSSGTHETRPEQPPAPSAGSPVTPATSPEPIHPPPHGVPGSPGKPKGNRAR
ncbi:hypothetical protein [Actinokineospora fastidiosa]|uniref:DUF8129 domain-containing protein n=1 Tax=Actinokineospora fastidiosa TaxID=1816 RepID=A0A918GFM3_9PSEU|nr:hypothetical protein [Actinokineospora fastidiosa]GGS34619.1 hypothetical protein GCM10010171_31350 [Actinokineospora fastidiosa]